MTSSSITTAYPMRKHRYQSRTGKPILEKSKSTVCSSDFNEYVLPTVHPSSHPSKSNHKIVDQVKNYKLRRSPRRNQPATDSSFALLSSQDTQNEITWNCNSPKSRNASNPRTTTKVSDDVLKFVRQSFRPKKDQPQCSNNLLALWRAPSTEWAETPRSTARPEMPVKCSGLTTSKSKGLFEEELRDLLDHVKAPSVSGKEPIGHPSSNFSNRNVVDVESEKVWDDEETLTNPEVLARLSDTKTTYPTLKNGLTNAKSSETVKCASQAKRQYSAIEIDRKKQEAIARHWKSLSQSAESVTPKRPASQEARLSALDTQKSNRQFRKIRSSTDLSHRDLGPEVARDPHRASACFKSRTDTSVNHDDSSNDMFMADTQPLPPAGIKSSSLVREGNLSADLFRDRSGESASDPGPRPPRDLRDTSDRTPEDVWGDEDIFNDPLVITLSQQQNLVHQPSSQESADGELLSSQDKDKACEVKPNANTEIDNIFHDTFVAETQLLFTPEAAATQVRKNDPSADLSGATKLNQSSDPGPQPPRNDHRRSSAARTTEDNVWDDEDMFNDPTIIALSQKTSFTKCFTSQTLVGTDRDGDRARLIPESSQSNSQVQRNEAHLLNHRKRTFPLPTVMPSTSAAPQPVKRNCKETRAQQPNSPYFDRSQILTCDTQPYPIDAEQSGPGYRGNELPTRVVGPYDPSKRISPQKNTQLFNHATHYSNTSAFGRNPSFAEVIHCHSRPGTSRLDTRNGPNNSKSVGTTAFPAKRQYSQIEIERKKLEAMERRLRNVNHSVTKPFVSKWNGNCTSYLKKRK